MKYIQQYWGHKHACIHVHTYAYTYICIYAYMHQRNKKENGNEKYMSENSKEQKMQNTFNIFLYTSLHCNSFRKKIGFPEILLQEKSERKALYFVCEIFFFVWILPFICSVMLFAYSQFADTGKAFPAHTRNNCARRFSTCVRPYSKIGSSPEEIEVWFGLHFWWLIPSHVQSLQPPCPATVPRSAGPPSPSVSSPSQCQLNPYTAADGSWGKKVKKNPSVHSTLPCLLPSRNVNKINMGFKHLESIG